MSRTWFPGSILCTCVRTQGFNVTLLSTEFAHSLMDAANERCFIVFAHDHKMSMVNNRRVYSSGSIGDLSQYSSVVGPIVSLTRLAHLDYIPRGATELSNPMAGHVGVRSLGSLANPILLARIWDLIRRSSGLIARFPSVIGLVSVAFAQIMRKPFLVEVVGSANDAFRLHSRLGVLMAPVIDCLTRGAVRNASHCVYVSEKALQAAYPTRGKSVAISNVVVRSRFTVAERDLELGAQRRSPRIVLGTAARVDLPYKGQHVVIEALPRLIEFGLDPVYRLAGGGDPARLKGIAAARGLSDRVQFCGQIARSELDAWYEELDLYVQPSLTEGLPRSLIEAMNLGIASVGSAVGGIPELLDSSYLFPRGSSSDLADIVQKLSDPSAALANRCAAIERARAFDREILQMRRECFLKDFIDAKH